MRFKLTTTSASSATELEAIDWSFSNLSNSGLHSFHWYPATYLSAIPGTLIPYLTSLGDTVLDPFCGSGTTGVEAIRLGRRFVGFDTNPVALLMSEAKLKFASRRSIDQARDSVLHSAGGLFGVSNTPQHPNHGELLQWYHPQTMDSLNRLLNAILALENRLTKRALLSVYSAILKNCSSQGRHWGWVCDNVKPKASEVVYKDAAAIFSAAVTDFSYHSDLAFRAAHTYSPDATRAELRRRSELIGGDCVAGLARMKARSIDAVVTSPPYYGVADYVKSQRLTYLWFDKDELAKQSLGFRSFEQLRSIEAGARSNRHRQNSHQLYMMFMESFFEACYRVLKRGATMALVVGESPSRASTIDQLIVSASKAGFSLNVRVGRDIRPNRRRLMAKVKGEEMLIFGS